MSKEKHAEAKFLTAASQDRTVTYLTAIRIFNGKEVFVIHPFPRCSLLESNRRLI